MGILKSNHVSPGQYISLQLRIALFFVKISVLGYASGYVLKFFYRFFVGLGFKPIDGFFMMLQTIVLFAFVRWWRMIYDSFTTSVHILICPFVIVGFSVTWRWRVDTNMKCYEVYESKFVFSRFIQMPYSTIGTSKNSV